MLGKGAAAIVAILVIAAAVFILFLNNPSKAAAQSTQHTSAPTSTAYTTTYSVTTTINELTFNPVTTYVITTTVAPSNITQNSSAAQSNKLVSVARAEYKAPYCQGASQAPVGQSGLPCAAEVGSTYHTFNSTSGAFDCAGFIQYVYSQIGIKLPRTAQAQFGNFYPADAKVVPVPGGQVGTVPGDLVYFAIAGDQDPEPAHVAMCLVAGCNTIIQDGGPPPGWPGSIAPLNAVLCTSPGANASRCVMGFRQVVGSAIFQSNSTNNTVTESQNCANLTLSMNSPDATASDECYWSGGKMGISYGVGKFSEIYSDIVFPYGSDVQYALPSGYANSTSCTYSNETYNLSAGNYAIQLTTSSYGNSCRSKDAYLKVV